VEAAGGGLISVGPPFFNLTVAPILALLFLLLPFGPMLSWRSGNFGSALKRLAPAAILAAITVGATLALSRGNGVAAVGLAIGVWLVIGGLIYLWTRLQRGGGSLAKIALLPLAVWSMTAAHIGAGVLTLGAVAETAFRVERTIALAPGESVDFEGNRVSLLEVGQVEGPNYDATRAVFRVERAGQVATLSTERRFFPTSSMPTTEVGILPRIDGDLYIAIGEAVRGEAGAWSARLYYNPLVHFIFIGAALMGLGGALSLVALARRKRSAPA
jgi:cytochrome c-type biogenesis protein CcmF